MKTISLMVSALSPTHPATALKDTSTTERRMARASSSSLMAGTVKMRQRDMQMITSKLFFCYNYFQHFVYIISKLSKMVFLYFCTKVHFNPI